MIFNSIPVSVFLYLSAGIIAFSVFWFFLSMVRRYKCQLIDSRCFTILTDISNNKGIPGKRKKEIISFIKRKRWFFLDAYSRLTDSVVLPEKEDRRIRDVLIKCRLEKRLLRDLKSRYYYRSVRAVIYLSLFKKDALIRLLIDSLEKQKNSTVKLFIVSALCQYGKEAVIPSIIDSLQGESEYYQQAVFGILDDFEGGIEEFYPILIQRQEKEIKLLLINLAEKNCPAILTGYIEKLVLDSEKDIVHKAFRVLAKIKAETLNYQLYLTHDDFLIRNLAAETLGNLPDTKSLQLLFDYINDPVIRKSSCMAITSLIRSRPEFLKIVIYRCLNEQNEQARIVLTDVLTNFVDYLMGKMIDRETDIVEKVFIQLFNHNKTSEIINFANRNADREIEEKLVILLKRIININPELKTDFSLHLRDDILEKTGISREKAENIRPARKEKHNLPLLVMFLFLAAIVPSLVCVLLALKGNPKTVFDGLYLYTVEFNYLFAGYAAVLSFIYILLLLFSIRGVKDQARKQKLVSRTFLYKRNVLPTISIISPAYNEESTIVESVNALFNLKYPEFEIIVVNDGSTDNTVGELIKAFELERTEVFIHNYLETQEIKAVYANKQYPELLVVDKINGGKADSLNAGINIARKEYFSGIDADSLLEQEALLNLTSHFVFSRHRIMAAGGNIFPVNGCTVKKGMLTNLRIPGRHMGRIQTLEYIRSFMAGRVGWSELRLLLIISGAFGVFHRRTVINAGGYLTQSSRYKKDTVGEDMELVVRLGRIMQENKAHFAMSYAYNANCWTEIPERFRILASQRDRWQRGLLDILTFHWKMMFNPGYGRIGLVGFPYFLIFEVIGPWIESLGFVIFIASLALGWVSTASASVILMATIGLGMCISMISMTISEYSRKYFPLRDKLKLLVYAFLENFGIRQLLNFLRVRGLVRMLFKAEGWGKMERVGWNKKKSAQKE